MKRFAKLAVAGAMSLGVLTVVEGGNNPSTRPMTPQQVQEMRRQQAIEGQKAIDRCRCAAMEGVKLEGCHGIGFIRNNPSNWSGCDRAKGESNETK
jgi:hypothetical protein